MSHIILSIFLFFVKYLFIWITYKLSRIWSLGILDNIIFDFNKNTKLEVAMLYSIGFGVALFAGMFYGNVFYHEPTNIDIQNAVIVFVYLIIPIIWGMTRAYFEIWDKLTLNEKAVIQWRKEQDLSPLALKSSLLREIFDDGKKCFDSKKINPIDFINELITAESEGKLSSVGISINKRRTLVYYKIVLDEQIANLLLVKQKLMLRLNENPTDKFILKVANKNPKNKLGCFFQTHNIFTTLNRYNLCVFNTGKHSPPFPPEIL